MRKILILFLILISFKSFAQCPNLGPNQILPCGINQTTLIADMNSCILNPGPRLTTNYTVSNIPFQPQPTGGTLINLTDDSQGGPYPIGFNFCFFGQTYNQFWIGSNGWISFSAGQPTTFTSQGIPSAIASVPKNCIMGPWQDWHPGIGGQIRYQTLGVQPCRRLVVTWNNVPMFSCTNLLGTFQIVIYEATNVIENHIINKPNCPQWAGGTAVQGIHNLAGNTAVVVPGRNSTQWTTQNNSWRWSPSGAPVNPTFTWFQVGNPVPIAVGTQTITVNPPPGGANYICRISFSGCNTGFESCSGVSQTEDTVFVVTSPNTMSINLNSSNPVCNADCNGQISASVSGGIPPYTYQWSNGNQSQSISGLCQGNYSVTATDINGCQISSNVTLTDPPVVSLTGPILHGSNINGPFSNFSVDTVCYSSNSFYQVTFSPNVVFNWQISNGGIISSGIGTNAISVNWSMTAPGFYPGAVSVFSIDSNGCQSDTLLLDVFIYRVSPSIDSIPPLCSNSPCVSILVSPQGGVLTGNGIQGQSFCPDSSIVGVNNINYTINSAGCVFSTSTIIEVDQTPILNQLIQTPLDSLIEICDNPSSTYTYTTFVNSLGTFDWSIDNTSISNQQNSLTVTWINWQLGYHEVSVSFTSIDGCSSDILIYPVFLVRCPTTEMWVPNAFTPNSDGINNYWSPIGREYKDVEYSIFDRWGQLIFKKKDLIGGWDGTYNGSNCQQGVYVYHMNWTDIDNNRYVKWGHIALIR